MNDFYYSDNNKRYYTFNYYLKQRFKSKISKISLNGGFTCPNRDGLKSTGGCIYCSDSNSGDFAGNPTDNLNVQFDTVKKQLINKWPDSKYLAYFQAGTNTYAPVPKLKQLYYHALTLPGVVGICIATRPDCISEEIADLLYELSLKTFVIIELGLQTIHDITGDRINRCHTYKEFLDGYFMLKNRGLNICVHIINGLPGETHDMMIQTIKEVAKIHPMSVKIHLLHVLKGTVLCEQYLNHEFDVLSMDEYIKIVVDQLELLPPDVVIQRLTGDGNRETLVAPMWSTDKRNVLNNIDKELKRRNSVQGIYCLDN